MSAALESTVKNAKNTFRALIVAGLVLASFYAQYLVFSERPIDRSLQVAETFLQRFEAWRQSNIGMSPAGELYFLSASPDFAALLPALQTVVPSQWGLIPGRMPLSIAPSTIDMAMAGYPENDGGFVYNDLHKKLLKIFLALFPAGIPTEGHLEMLNQQRMKFSSPQIYLPGSRAGEMEPRWTENVIGFLPSQMGSLNSFLLTWFATKDIRKITYFLPVPGQTKLELFKPGTNEPFPLSLQAVEQLPKESPVRQCVIDQIQNACLQFIFSFEYLAPGDPRTAGIAGQFDKAIVSKLSFPGIDIVYSSALVNRTLTITEEQLCAHYFGGGCPTIDLTELVDFTARYGLLNVEALRAITGVAVSTSIDILGIKLANIEYIVVGGSLILLAMMFLLTINVSAIARALERERFEEYWELITGTSSAMVVAAAGCALLPLTSLVAAAFVGNDSRLQLFAAVSSILGLALATMLLRHTYRANVLMRQPLPVTPAAAADSGGDAPKPKSRRAKPKTARPAPPAA